MPQAVAAAAAFFEMTVGAFIFTAVSVGYQLYQAKKMRDAAKKAEEARKGFELVTEMPASTLPIVYGRAMVGGIRVYATTRNDFIYTAPNSDKQFMTGAASVAEETVQEVRVHSFEDGTETQETVTTTRPAIPSRRLDANRSGAKNEFLFVQQALCQGPINAVYDVILAGSMDLDEPSLGGISNSDPGRNAKSKGAMRIDVHYGTGAVADAIMTANDGARQDAKFPNIAYATGAFRLDRDNPQFNQIPDMQFFIEGRKIRKVVGGVLSNTYEYSNNPSWCLLDYLLDNVSGKGLTLDEVDLPSFEAAAAICDTVVMPNAIMGGKVWQPIDGVRNVTTRALPLYECNIVVDTEKPLRTNVQSILSTMGDARLVWSQGKYKLLIQYPETNAAIALAGTLSDDDLVLGEKIEISWPSSGERLNFATVKYHDESMDFKENSVSWPPKEAGTYFKGVSADAYPPMSGWDGADDWKVLLNSYAVWSGDSNTSTMSWKFVVKNTGTHTMSYAADNSATVSVNGSAIASADKSLKTHSFFATRDTIVTISVTASSSTKDRRGFGAKIIDSMSLIPWSTRSPAYQNFIRVDQTNTLYTTFKTEDNGVDLEADIFEEGITDYYHALAKAEELVRTSRSAFTIKFKYILKNHYFEPGDFIRLDSDTAGLSELYIRVSEVKLDSDNTASLTGVRFDWTQLAWNVADDAYARPSSPYDFDLRGPAWVHYEPSGDTIYESSGKIDWAEVPDSRVVGYIVYIHETDTFDANGDLLFVELGRASHPKFRLPALAVPAGIFGVRAYTSTGAMSPMTLSDSGTINAGKPPPAPTTVTLTQVEDRAGIQIDWNIPTTRGDGSTYDDPGGSAIYRSQLADIASASLLGTVAEGTQYIDLDELYGSVYYWVANVSRRGRKSPLVAGTPAPIEFLHFGGVVTDPTKPNAPFDVTVTSGINYLNVSWSFIDSGVGGGIDHFEVWRAPSNAFAAAVLVGTTHADSFWYSSTTGTESWFWIISVTKGLGKSDPSSPAAYGKVGLIGNQDLADEIIEARNIAAGGITMVKLEGGLTPVVYVPAGDPFPTTKLQEGRAELISYQGKLYKWNGTAYVPAIGFPDLSGLLSEDQIADEIISTAKFAAGLRPVEIVATLPFTNLTEGRVVFLTTDGKLYRYTGGTWTSQIPAEDLSTQISAGMIAANAVTAGTIAAGAVNTSQLAADAIVSSKIAAGAVTTDKMTANTINGNRIQAGTLDANKIIAGSITSNQIASNTITASNIATGTITADKIQAGTITAGAGVFAAGAITNFALGTGVVEEVNIKDAAISTLKVAGGSVTTMGFASSGSASGTSSWDGPTVYLYGMPAGSSGVAVQGFVTLKSSGYNGSGYLEIWRSVGGGFTALTSLPISIVDDKNYTFGVGAFDSNPSGAYSAYRLRLAGVNPGFVIAGAHILATGGKR